MIPKVIHYCWFGHGHFSPEIEMCLASWEQYCPGWSIRLWTEDNSPMEIPWIRDAYKHRKYAFVADYMRFWALYSFGGVYMDTDMLLIKPIDLLLENGSFLGREDAYNANMAIIGAEKGNLFCKMCMDYYDSIQFDMVSPPIITRFITPTLFQYGLLEQDETQVLSNGLLVLQSDWFYPIHYSEEFELNEISHYVKPNTRGIHLWNKSWKDELQMLSVGEYRQGFKLAFKRIRETPVLPLRYYKKLFKYLIYWIVRR